MVQSSPHNPPADDAAAKAEAERKEAGERQEAERRRAEQNRSAEQRSTEQRNPAQAAADQRNPDPPRDDGKNVMERAQERAVGETSAPVPTQAELDEQKERVMHPGAKPASQEAEQQDRSMQPAPGRNYQTR